ncbi:hypothetical protein [Streptobacillus ratti]|nr:hypothetical protein [Streptobacillus ratti]
MILLYLKDNLNIINISYLKSIPFDLENVDGGLKEYKSIYEKEEEIKELRNIRIDMYTKYFKVIDSVLKLLEEDKYYYILVDKYINKKTNFEMEYKYKIDSRTILRHKNRLLNEFEKYLDLELIYSILKKNV